MKHFKSLELFYYNDQKNGHQKTPADRCLLKKGTQITFFSQEEKNR